jgi:hypothetical protein
MKKTFFNIVLTFAIIYAILGILIFLFTSPDSNPKDAKKIIVGFITLFLYIGIFVMAVKYYKTQGYEVSIGSGIKLGMLSGLIGGLIIAVYSYIYITYLHPEFVDQSLEMTRKILEENDQFNQEMIEEQMKISQKIFFPALMFGQIITGWLYGLIGGLLGGIFYKTPSEDY